MDNLITAMKELPDECSYEYELELKKIEKSLDNHEITILSNIIFDQKLDEKVRYAAFYCMANIYRHKLESNHYGELLSESFDWKESHESLTHLKTLAYLIPPYQVCSEQILKDEYDLALKHRNTIGYKHAFAELFAVVCEQGNATEELKTRWGKRAERFANDVIVKSKGEYAKYYCTLARILAINGKFDEADIKLQIAIQKEDSNRSDFAIIIGQYQYFRLSIQAQKIANQLNSSDIQERIDRLQNSVVSNIEIIAFFQESSVLL